MEIMNIIIIPVLKFVYCIQLDDLEFDLDHYKYGQIIKP